MSTYKQVLKAEAQARKIRVIVGIAFLAVWCACGMLFLSWPSKGNGKAYRPQVNKVKIAAAKMTYVAKGKFVDPIDKLMPPFPKSGMFAKIEWYKRASALRSEIYCRRALNRGEDVSRNIMCKNWKP